VAARRGGHRLRRPGSQARGRGSRSGRALKKKPSSFVKPAAFVCALALLVRIAYLLSIRGTPLTGALLIDSDTYDRFARMILTGSFGGENVYAVNVLYPWFVALCYRLFGPALFSALAVQVALDALTCTLAAWIGARAFGRAAGIACGVLLALCGPLVFYAGALLTPTLVAFLGAVTLASLALWTGDKHAHWAALAGVALGLATLARGNNALFLVLALPGFLLLAPRSVALRAWAAFAACALVPPLLATLRNLVVTGHPVPVAANYAAFWIGHNPLANGLYVLPPWAVSGEYANEVWGLNAAIAHQVGHPMSLAETAHWLFDQGVSWALGHPVEELRLAATKFRYFWNNVEPPTNLSYHFARVFSPLLAFLPVTLGVLGPLGLLGAWWAGLRRGAFLLGWILVALLTALLFYVSAEYRLPMLPALGVFAGFALVEIVRAVRKPGRRLVEAVVLLPLLALAFWNAPAPLAMQARVHAEYAKFGTLYARKGDLARARTFFEQSTALAPDYAPGWQGLAAVLERSGDEAGAVRTSLRARQLGVLLPTPTGAISDSGLAAAARFQAGDFAGALERFTALEAAARAAGDSALASGLLNNAGLCRFKLGDLEGAARDFEHVIAERPRAVKAHYNLGRVRAAQGRREEALAQYQAALALSPNEPGVREEMEALLATRP
jgi:tetratricopeptide (TPR) repeat protein